MHDQMVESPCELERWTRTLGFSERYQKFMFNQGCQICNTAKLPIFVNKRKQLLSAIKERVVKWVHQFRSKVSKAVKDTL